MTRRVYLGVDCGSVTTKAALIDEEKNVVAHSYQRNKNVIDSVEECLGDLRLQDYSVLGCGVTGSGFVQTDSHFFSVMDAAKTSVSRARVSAT